MTDTIFALSSGRPPAAIAVIRLSGPAAVATATKLAGRLPKPRTATLRTLRDADAATLDRALVMFFPGPNSATGEDLVEFHCHGGAAVVAAVERALAGQAATRRATPGEFTRRALTNGRIDLAEAHGLADLLEAETERERIAALDAAEGRVSRLIGGWLDRLTAMAAQVEALLDFSDEDDVIASASSCELIVGAMAVVAGEIDSVLTAPSVERLRDGLRVVIAGPPNAGKSTLLNALVERDAAIVSAVAGTTRDRVEASVVRGGLTYSFCDTAGLRETDDPVEAIGVNRAREALATADLILWLGDEDPPHDGAIWIHSRADQPGRREMPVEKAIATSAAERGSIDALWAMIAKRNPVPARDLVLLHFDQRHNCADALKVLRPASADDPIIVAEMLRTARVALGQIVGVNATESMLDALFVRFCLGK